VLEAFDKALAQGSASTTVDGKMIDVAMANAARRVLDEAAARKKAGGTA
jgi:citrate lyase subunit beta/citryl-CoA lyase